MPDKESFFSEINKASAEQSGGFSLNPNLGNTSEIPSLGGNPEPVNLATPVAKEVPASTSIPKKPAKINLNGSGSTMNLGSQPVKSKKKLFGILLGIFLLLIIGVGAYILIAKPENYMDPRKAKDNQAASGNDNVDSSDMFESPINGVYVSQDEAKNFKDRKPIAVMVNNYVVARPSSGLSFADIVYEVVAEGGITRLMPIFHSKIPEQVTSVRSARYYFAELAAPYSPHFIHWGAAHVPPCQKAGTCPKETEPDTDAYDRIVKLGLPNLDGGNYSCDRSDCAFGRDQAKLSAGVALEHTAGVKLPLIYQLAKEIRPQEAWHQFAPFTSWKFKDEASMEERGTIGLDIPITYTYWDTMPDFSVKWVYDKEKNEYIRYQGGVKQTDFLNNQELRAKNVIVRFTVETKVGDKKAHLYQQITGTGNALIFLDGKVIEATWSRSTHDEMDVYKTKDGEEVVFNRGQIWVQLVPSTNKVSYQSDSSSTITP